MTDVLTVVAVAAFGGAAIGGAVLVLGVKWPRPRRMLLRDGVLVAPALQRVRWAQIVLFVSMGVGGYLTGVVDDLDNGLTGIGVYFMILAVLSLSLGGVVYAIGLSRPTITISEAGVRAKVRLLTWETLESTGLPRRIPSASWQNRVFDMDADPGYVRSVIEYYVAHPEARASIGRTLPPVDRADRWDATFRRKSKATVIR